VSRVLPHLLRDTAARLPDACAVEFGDERLTYAALADRTSRLAAALAAAGVRPGDRVGLWFPRSTRSVTGVCAALEARAVYVPLDPLSPRARIAAILRDGGIRHLVTTADRLASLAELADAPPLDAALLVDAGDGPAPPRTRVVTWDEVRATPPRPPGPDAADSDLAYVLYTSGSTGAPKGVMISHRAALAFVDWTHDEFGVRAGDVVWNHAPLHFDLSIFDIFTTLKGGGTVCPVPEKLSTFPIRLAEFLRDRRITVAYCVPSALTMMLLRGGLAKLPLPQLRLVLFAGEVFPLKYLRAVRQALGVRMANLYGPTETNVCTWHEVSDAEVAPERDQPVPIGRPTPSYACFAVTDRGTRAAPGEEGELYAQGPGICSGYWGDEERSRRLLVPNPLPDGPPGLCVRTGDIVTQRADGVFLYVGRRDNMVKSKGYRIELGEIEAALYGHPHVTAAAVVPVPDDEVGNRLLACVVPDAPGALSAADVRGHCGARLPKYMVPELVQFYAALPQTSTGKIDRPALLREYLAGLREAPGAAALSSRNGGP
jgi:amino acid adenylation domain-containing protein